MTAPGSASPASPRYRLGFDIGGTFTDFVLLAAASGGISLHKCLTTPNDPADGALEGIRSICAAAGIIADGCCAAAQAALRSSKGAAVHNLVMTGLR